MPFDPTTQADEATYEGHLDQEPMGSVLSQVIRHKVTGRLTIRDEQGQNHLFLMQGRPVGVVLSQVLHPLGQLLLELGKVDSAQFVRAQRLIGDGERLPGQVFMEIGAITEGELKETLAIQARRKAQRFVSARGVAFEFSKGLSFLTGFKSTPMDGAPLLYHALSARLDAAARKAFLQKFGRQQVRATNANLGAPLDAFGFGRAEERFLGRLTDWHTVAELDQFGTLPGEDVALILAHLEGMGQLEVAPPGVVHPKAGAAPAPALSSPKTPAPVAVPPAAKPRAATPAPAPIAGVPADVSGLRARPTPNRKDYGPAPNSAVAVTGTREVSDKKSEKKDVPSIVIDFDSLGVPPSGKR